MPGALWSMALAVYSSDSGSNYNVGVSDGNFNAGGFTLAAAGSQITYPKPWRMRHVWGFQQSENGPSRHKLPCAQLGVTFLTALVFSINYTGGSVAFSTFGRIGEKRPFRV
jgi:hypothetical protein